MHMFSCCPQMQKSCIDTVAVWTQKKNLFTIDAPPGVSGVPKNLIYFFLQMKLFSFCAKIDPKRHKLHKPSKLKKKCQKKPVF